MLVLRAANYRRMPWKNGGGETAEIAVRPEGAGLDDFDWRVSMARVSADGPFSTFAGVDRTLSILEGEGLVLEVEAIRPVTLDRDSDPFSFAADVATGSRLLGGPITDLNVMTRRGRYSHAVRRLEVDGACDLAAAAAQLVLVNAAGDLTLRTGSSAAGLGRFDAALVDGISKLGVAGRGRLLVIELAPL